MRNNLDSATLYALIDNDKYVFTGTAIDIANRLGTSRQYVYNLNNKPLKTRQVLKVGKREPVVAIYSRKDTLDGVFTLREFPYTLSYLYRMIKRGERGDTRKTAYIIDYEDKYYTTPLDKEEEKWNNQQVY